MNVGYRDYLKSEHWQRFIYVVIQLAISIPSLDTRTPQDLWEGLRLNAMNWFDCKMSYNELDEYLDIVIAAGEERK